MINSRAKELNGDNSLHCDVEMLFPNDEQILFIYLYLFMCVYFFLFSTVNTPASCSKILCINSVCHKYSAYTEESH